MQTNYHYIVFQIVFSSLIMLFKEVSLKLLERFNGKLKKYVKKQKFKLA